MTAHDSTRNTGLHTTGSPGQATAIVLAIFIAMSLAIACVVHALLSLDGAVAPNAARMPAPAITASTSAAGVSEPHPSAGLGQVSGQTDASR